MSYKEIVLYLNLKVNNYLIMTSIFFSFAGKKGAQNGISLNLAEEISGIADRD
jgi:hypothetical protein